MLNEDAPKIVVVGKGPNIEARAKRFLESDIAVPTYLKHDTNAWELVGSYRAIEYVTDGATIRKHRGDRPFNEVAGILFLERTDEAKVDKWFRRNCNDVLSRECTAVEKADVLAYLNALKP